MSKAKNFFHAKFEGDSKASDSAKTDLDFHIEIRNSDKQEAYNYYGTQLGVELFQKLGDFVRGFDGTKEELSAALSAKTLSLD